jgi:cell division protein FtsZ
MNMAKIANPAIEIDDEDDFFVEQDDLDNEAVYNVNVKVFGVGGGGGNAVSHMAELAIPGVEYYVVNTDVPALRNKDKKLMHRIQIGKKTTKGRGAGGQPEVGAESAREDRETIEQAIDNAQMVFIAAGMGGGTGTGAAPVIASIAREKGILTVGVVTKPFDYERVHKMNLALSGISEMRKFVDTLVIIPNQKLLEINEKNLTMIQAYERVDDVLCHVVHSISEILNKVSYVNIDFADLKRTLENSKDAHIAIGSGKGDGKIEEAFQKIITSPLLETSIKNAKRLLVMVTMSENILIEETNDLMNKISSAAHPDVDVIHGSDYDTSLDDEIIVTVIATDFVEADINLDSFVIHRRPPADSIKDNDEERNDVTSEIPTRAFIDVIKDSNDTKGFGIDSSERGFEDLESIFKRRK